MSSIFPPARGKVKLRRDREEPLAPDAVPFLALPVLPASPRLRELLLSSLTPREVELAAGMGMFAGAP